MKKSNFQSHFEFQRAQKQAMTAAGLVISVDAELFRVCIDKYMSAEESFYFELDGKTTKIDSPHDAPILAVVSYLKDNPVAMPVFIALTMRLQFFVAVYKQRKRFATWFGDKGDNENEAVEIAPAIVYACANARMTKVKEEMRFDLDDVEKLAKEFDTRVSIDVQG